MRKNVFRIFLIASAMALAGCGDDTVVGGGSGTPVVPPGTQVPATVTLLASSPQLSSNASQLANGVTLTALVKDSSNVIISGATVSFSTADTGVNLTITNSVTDSSGFAKAVLTVGSSKANRSLTVTAVSGSASDTVTINVVGTTITISGSANGQFNTASTYVATLTDAGGAGISGESLTFSSAGGSISPATAQATDPSGQATVSFIPTTSNPTTSLSATALGVTATQTIALSQDSFAFTAPTANQEINLGTNQPVSVTWTRSGAPVAGTVTFSSTRGTLLTTSVVTNGSGVAATTINSTQAGFATLVANGSGSTSSPTTSVIAEFIATTPTQISVQADPAVISTNQTSTISAVVRDASNNLVKNAVVNFALTVDTTGGQLSAPSATTNSQGVASVVYQASSSPSAQNGVTISACASCNTTPVSGSATLTIGSRAARIVLGTGNEIFEPDPTFYEFPYVAIVTDNAGNPAPDADLRLTITPSFYMKGYYVENQDGELVPFITALCPNEDINLNGIIDSGEDTDNDNFLDPTNVAQVPNPLVLDNDGKATFVIRYPQSYGNWTKVKLSAKAIVSGTESTETSRFTLPISVGDAENPPGNPSPYGVVSRCDLDDDAAPVVEFDNTTTNQSGDEATPSVLTFTLLLDRTFTEAVVVPLSYSGGAARGTDYSAPGSVTVPAGDTSVNFTVTIINDIAVEPTEFGFIQIAQPTNALVGGNNFAVFSIISND